jgi:hypothetical protein
MEFPSNNRDVLIEGRIGRSAAIQEVIAFWNGREWCGGQGEAIFTVERWRDLTDAASPDRPQERDRRVLPP